MVQFLNSHSSVKVCTVNFVVVQCAVFDIRAYTNESTFDNLRKNEIV